ncbi:MAG: hypothetical protein AB1861_02015 [Cyanobacteriota bacterium]
MYESGENQDFPQLAIADEFLAFQARRKQERYFKRLFWFILFFLIAGTVYLFEHLPRSISSDKSLLALGITWMGFFPLLQYFNDPKRPPIPFFPMVGIYYAAAYGLPMFAADFAFHYRFPLEDVTSTALMLALIGMSGMNAAFFLSKSLLWKKVSPLRLKGPFSLTRLLILTWLLLLGHFANAAIPFIRGIPSIGQLLEPAGFLAFGIFYILWKREVLPRSNVLPLVAISLVILMVRLSSGSLAQVFFLLFFMFLVIWRENKRFPLLLPCIALVFILVFNPVKDKYRDLTWEGDYSRAGAIEKAQLFIDLAIEQFTGGGNKVSSSTSDDDTSSLVNVVDRVGYINFFSKVVEDTPARVPYWGGQTYLPLLTKFIPRFIWPNKPEETIANQFGRRYNYLSSTDFTTALNLPWLIEAYANFGDFGMLVVMPLIGAFLSFLEQKFNRHDTNFLEFLIGATVLFRLALQESNFSLMVGGIFTLTIAFYVLFSFWIGRSKKNKAINLV